jgi:hypothetical protein
LWSDFILNGLVHHFKLVEVYDEITLKINTDFVYSQVNILQDSINLLRVYKLASMTAAGTECLYWYYACAVVYLITLFQKLRLHSTEWKGDRWMMNWKECGRKQQWPNLRCYLGICLEGLSKTTKNLGQDSRSPGQDLDLGHPEIKAVVLTTWPQCLVTSCLSTSDFYIVIFTPYATEVITWSL